MAREAWNVLPKITDVMRNNMSEGALYDTFFRHRGMVERFTFPEKKLLRIIMDVAWKNREPMDQNAQSVLTTQGQDSLQTDVFGREVKCPWLGEVAKIGKYFNEETWATVPEDGAEGSMISAFYYWANIHGLKSKDLARKRASELKATKDVRADLVATNIDYQRGERPSSRGDGTREMTVFGQLITDLRTEFSSIFTLSAHSPGTACKCLENDMPFLDLSPMSLLVDAAEKMGFIEGDLEVVTSDEGALELGVSVKDLLEKKTGRQVGVISGVKKKDGNIAKVVFLERDLERVKGKTVFIGEDVIDSGKTLLSIIDDLLNAGAKKVIVLDVHAVMSTPESGGAERLGKKDRVEIIVTNSVRAELPERVKETQAKRKNIHFVDVLTSMQTMIRMDQMGQLRDIYSNEETRRKLIEATGLDISPWLVSKYVDEAELILTSRLTEEKMLESPHESIGAY